MSLTKHLDDKNSLVGQFMQTQFPNLGSVTRESNAKLRAVPTPVPLGKVPYGTIGAASDYRVR